MRKKLGFLIFLLSLALVAGGTGCGDSTNPDDEKESVQQGELYVDIYDPEKACDGTTLFADLHDAQNPRIVEVDMEGAIVWEYVIPPDLKEYHDPGMDVELLPNGHILFVLPGYGIHEIDREGNLQWFHLDSDVSHDADRLSNGNTLYAHGNGDGKNDEHAKEVTPLGEIVWSWSAKSSFNIAPYDTAFYQGWTHTNAVDRLANGNTLVSLRNFDTTVEVDTAGTVVWSFDWSGLGGCQPHEPEIQPDNGLLICLHRPTPHQVVEIDRNSGGIVWQYYRDNLRTTRDSDRLSNGNTLIVGVMDDTEDSVIFEVTESGEIVWQLKVKDTLTGSRPGFFYKAERIEP